MCPAVTVISSGDSEGHDHPQASVVAASAITGYQQTSGDKLISPLIYSTELARSTTLSKASKATLERPAGTIELAKKDLSKLNVEFSVVKGRQPPWKTHQQNTGSSVPRSRSGLRTGQCPHRWRANSLRYTQRKGPQLEHPLDRRPSLKLHMCCVKPRGQRANLPNRCSRFENAYALVLRSHRTAAVTIGRFSGN